MKRILTKPLAFLKSPAAKRMGPGSIRTRLILAFLVPILLIILQGVISYTNTARTARNLSSQASVTAMQTGSKYLEAIFGSTEALAGELFSDADVQSFFSGRYDKSDSSVENKLYKSIFNRLAAMKTFNSNIYNITLISPDKDIPTITSVNSTEVRLPDLKEAGFYKKLEKNNVGAWFGKHDEFDKFISSNATFYGLSYMRMIKNVYSMGYIGMLVIDIKPPVVSELMADIKLAEKGQEIYLVSPDGRVIVNGKDAAGDDRLVEQKFFKELAAGKKTEGLANVAFDGEKYLMTFSKVGQSGYVLLGLIPESELNAASRSVVATTVILIAVAAFIAFGTGYIIANNIKGSISKIIGVSKKAASGDLSVHFDSGRRDELGVLAGSINSMMASMRGLIEQTMAVSDQVSESVEVVLSTSMQVSVGSTEISGAIQEISEGASAQATDSEYGVKRMGDLAEDIGSVTDNARSMDETARTAMGLTQEGITSIHDLDEKAGRTTAISKEIMASIQELNDNSRSIGQIVKVIGNIANQTNLLSLNAAIEAARAGAMGKGFAVVADEVRKLAEKSVTAANEISAIIKDTQGKTARTVEQAAATESILISQNHAVQNTIQIFERISESMGLFSRQVDQIRASIANMESNKEKAVFSIQNISAVSQQTAASSEEVAASAQEQLAGIELLTGKVQELKSTADALKENISKFKLG
jgi:methyl-accepting chemotaxis protein